MEIPAKMKSLLNPLLVEPCKNNDATLLQFAPIELWNEIYSIWYSFVPDVAVSRARDWLREKMGF